MVKITGYEQTKNTKYMRIERENGEDAFFKIQISTGGIDKKTMKKVMEEMDLTLKTVTKIIADDAKKS